MVHRDYIVACKVNLILISCKVSSFHASFFSPVGVSPNPKIGMDGAPDDWIKAKEPELHETVVSALCGQLNDATINMVVTYVVPPSRTFISCASKVNNVQSTEYTEDDDRESKHDVTESVASRDVNLTVHGVMVKYHRLCVLSDDLSNDRIKDVYLRITHYGGQFAQRGYPGASIFLARPCVRCHYCR